MSLHTNTPWIADHGPWAMVPKPTVINICKAGDATSIGYVHKFKNTKESDANAARIVACINAFHGADVSTEAITEGIVVEMHTALKQSLGVIVEFANLNGFRNMTDQELGRTVTGIAESLGHLLNKIECKS